MGRRNVRRQARPARFLEEVRRVLAEGGTWRDVEALSWQLRDPKDRAEMERLAGSCWLCGGEGHKRSECPEFICRACGKPGHKAKRCPEAAEAR